MRIVFIGPPGAGKGTQCRRLAGHLSIPHLSTGEMLRNTDRESSIGKVVAGYIDDGHLAPDYLVMPIVTRRLAEPDCVDGCLFDGFPRTVNQAEQLDAYLSENDWQLDIVLYLQVPDPQLVSRLLKRAKVENRADDNEAAISERLRVFQEQTAPVLRYYQQAGLVSEIDGTQPPEEVFAEICRQIADHR